MSAISCTYSILMSETTKNLLLYFSIKPHRQHAISGEDYLPLPECAARKMEGRYSVSFYPFPAHAKMRRF